MGNRESMTTREMSFEKNPHQVRIRMYDTNKWNQRVKVTYTIDLKRYMIRMEIKNACGFDFTSHNVLSQKGIRELFKIYKYLHHTTKPNSGRDVYTFYQALSSIVLPHDYMVSLLGSSKILENVKNYMEIFEELLKMYGKNINKIKLYFASIRGKPGIGFNFEGKN